MTLNEALAIVNSRRGGDAEAIYYLACGFEPLHLKTLLHAHLLQRLPDFDGVRIQHGIYGDFRGNLDSAAKSEAIGAAIVLEWSDIDPRLGMRASGGWSSETKAQILTNVEQRFASFAPAIKKIADRMPVAFVPPSTPLPPIGNTTRLQNSVFELQLEQQLAAFLLNISHLDNVRVLQRQQAAPCLDAKMELLAGFPYTIPFAGSLASALAGVLCPSVPKKGLITDLDDTLWAGIVGEVGTEGVSWSQDQHTQIHGLYQQMLGHLASCGVLLGVCSKNELSTVEAAFARKDLLLHPSSFFPVCANWGTKSASVGQILKVWNISADAVVFVDDNPMELEEVERAHPGITCRRFSAKDPASVWGLLGEMRDFFGKPVILEEDRLRQASIRASAQMQEMADDPASPEFLRDLGGSVSLDWTADASDKRPLELINKTNQFNLNGRRIGDGEWRRLVEREDSVLAVVSYRDKFGPLGKIAVLLASKQGRRLKVSHWVMSCRAFSRRVEHHTLDCLFQTTGAEDVEFSFEPTAKNQPLQDFFESLGVAADGSSVLRVSRADFIARCGDLPHEVSNLKKVEAS